MSQFTTYKCDTCGRSERTFFTKQFILPTEPEGTAVDICNMCQASIVRLALSGKRIVIRPFCKKCKGLGWHDGPRDNETVRCKNCRL